MQGSKHHYYDLGHTYNFFRFAQHYSLIYPYGNINGMEYQYLQNQNWEDQSAALPTLGIPDSFFALSSTV